MKTKLALVILFLIPIGLVYGQQEKYLTIELGGSGGLGSINFEKEFFQNEKTRISFRTGFSFMPIDKNNGSVLIFPQMVQYRYGNGKHFALLGMGLTPSITTTLSGVYIRMPLSFGYGFEPPHKKYCFRMAYTPLVSFLFDLQWQHWGGVTFAYKLNSRKDSK